MSDSRQSKDLDLQQDPQQLVQLFKDPIWGASKLRQVFIFAKLTDDELIRLYSLGTLVTLKPKASAVIEGEPTRGMFLLLQGRVSVYKTDPTTGSFVRLTMLEEGANFGELSLFDQAPRSATVSAETVCYLFQLDADVFHGFLGEGGSDRQARFYKNCAEELAVRFRRLNGDYLNSQQLLWKHALRRAE